MDNNELKHYGVLGMKWGVRRYQNKDGSLTSAGKKRITVKRTFNTNEPYDLTKLKRDINDLQSDTTINVSDKTNIAYVKKQKYIDEKVKKKLNKETSISKRRSDLEKEYIGKGLTKEEAAITAYKREKTEKILLATAGLTVAAATAYVAYKKYDYSVDRFIEANSRLKRVAASNDNAVRDAFYATNNKKDMKKYIGNYGNQIKVMKNGQPYLKDIKVTDKIKVASDKTGYETFKKMVNNDKDFSKATLEDVKKFIAASNNKTFNEKELRNLENRIVTKKMYEKFNNTLVGRGESSTKFYEELRKRGYDAVRDVNDRKYSGYNSKNPVIVFNKNKVVVDKVREITDAEMLSNILKDTKKDFSKSIGKISAVAVGYNALRNKANRSSITKRENEIISQYRQEHPNSKISRYKILENYYGGK